jgi:hypothetical protein
MGVFGIVPSFDDPAGASAPLSTPALWLLKDFSILHRRGNPCASNGDHFPRHVTGRITGRTLFPRGCCASAPNFFGGNSNVVNAGYQMHGP